MSRVSLSLGAELPGCYLEAVRLWEEAIGCPERAFALLEALSAGVPVRGWQ